MKDTKGFIEEIIPRMDSPEKVYQLFEGLGYKTLDPSFRGKEAWGSFHLKNILFRRGWIQSDLQILKNRFKNRALIIENKDVRFEKSVDIVVKHLNKA